MSVFAEIVGYNEVDHWQARVQGYFSQNPEVVAERLDQLRERVNSQGLYLADGNEVEFMLVPNRPGGSTPDNDAFYLDFVKAYCGDALPLIVPKGAVVDPGDISAPLFLCSPRDGTFNYEGGKKIMEGRTWPSFDWRESERRYWRMISTAGNLAARYDCKAKILSTHETTSVYRQTGGKLEKENNTTGGKMLLAMQGARRILYPFEAFVGMSSPKRETGPYAAALWDVGRFTTQTRYPVFGIVDTRLGKLAATAGISRHLEGEPALGGGRVHECVGFGVRNGFAREVSALSDLMVWDETLGRMILPENMSRSIVHTAYGQKVVRHLNYITNILSGGQQSEFSLNNARVLRESIGGLSPIRYARLHTDENSSYKRHLEAFFDFAELTPQSAVRIVYDGAIDTLVPLVEARKRAMQMPEVAELLGTAVMASLTPPERAHNMRAQLVRTAPKELLAR